MKTPTNDPARKGQLAAQPQFFNGFRFKVAPVHTRFDAVQWFVWDAETPEDDGSPSVVRQEDTLEAAVRGLFNPLVESAPKF